MLSGLGEFYHFEPQGRVTDDGGVIEVADIQHI